MQIKDDSSSQPSTDLQGEALKRLHPCVPDESASLAEVRLCVRVLTAHVTALEERIAELDRRTAGDIVHTATYPPPEWSTRR